MFTFKINNYRAVKEATIRIDGITVLAGINGSGKSTLSRWLYYMVNAAHNFEIFQRQYFIDSLVLEIEKVQRVFRPTPKSGNYQSVKTQIRRMNAGEELDWELLKDLYNSFLEKAEQDLRQYAEERPLGGRLSAYLLGQEKKAIRLMRLRFATK